ncbi:uncharacterized protein BDR25DRAFT_351766 [Lindgomyces ingoldianus]|uniref:Uncharacterized protein n=1 Tax=Lindgomyces ingoldianus TaxID=673940 RepID=A0ACB6R6T0_9PLEO|nr:uncharacterized protein BDR25DRAFT_351766 [Lindgomyces ingoldianus]KAF2474237.1 hypothetical protein BDR25DRAFT_351766 [Lindgomyces ingoldianus]
MMGFIPTLNSRDSLLLIYTLLLCSMPCCIRLIVLCPFWSDMAASGQGQA